MGIQGLLPLLKSVMAPIHIKDLQGCRVAVDTYSWLHKGALSCSVELCKGLPTSRYIDYCMHRVNLLQHYGVKPILVFDGGFLPMKIEQENKRGRSRKENLARAIEHESNGNSAAAYECYQKAVDISPTIAFQLIQVLKKANVDYIVAPYEADAQMTFLAVSKQVDAVITEDSDLIPFGCPRIIFKMDKYGQGVEFQYAKLGNNKDINLSGFTKEMVLQMCILSGCDYLPSLPGMGLKKAHALIMKFKDFEKVIRHLRYSTMAVPPVYEESFKKAIWTFQYQRVYDPNIDDIVHLSELPIDTGGDLDFLGPSLPQHLAKAIAKGEVDPISKLPFEGDDSPSVATLQFYQPKDFKPDKEKRKVDLPAQKNILTNYFCFASLEAKRKFRAPRISPKATGSSSPSARQEVGEEDTASKRNCSPISLFDLVNSGDDVLSSADSIEKEVLDSPLDGSGQSPKQRTSLELKHLNGEPCSALNKERGPECSFDRIDEKSRLGRKEATVTSSYTRQKPEDNDSSNKNNKATFRSSYFKTVDENAPDHKHGKVVIRSSYFKKKSMDAIDAVNEHEKQNPKVADSDGSMYESNVTENASVRSDKCESLNTKRKVSELTTVQMEHLSKHTRIEATIPDESECPSTDERTMECKVKFGCDISHMDRYADISGRSLEKFASVVSSFQFNSSGSRASGLRAPLRDIRNNLPNRSPPTVTDISRFSYVPNTKKAVVASRRR